MAGRIPQLKRIDLEKNWLIANGNKYWIQDSVSVGRYGRYLKGQHILTYGATVEDHLKFVDFVITQLSGPLTGMTVHKILQNAFNVKDRYKNFIHDDTDEWLRFATLFINKEGEDISVYDEKVMQSKMQDWKAEGFDMQDFFLLCARQLPVLRIRLMQSRPEMKALDANS